MAMKPLLLGAAAALVTVGAASAADLPMLKAEPVEYVKVCSTFGAGFFYIPGTDTCLKLSGELRADAVFIQPQNTDDTTAREGSLENFAGRARVQFDARTSTDYGALRSFISLDFNILDNGATNAELNTFDIDKAFIQFNGFTAGYAETYFAFYDNLYGDTLFAPYFGAAGDRELFAYTATFGGGFAATLSVESAAGNRTSIVGLGDGLGAAVDYGGSQMPDFVGSLFYDAGPNGFGKAQVMAAVHQVRSLFEPYDTDYGFAAGAAASVNLPFLAGAYVAVEGEYAEGATRYLGGSAAIGAYDELGGLEDVNGNAATALASGFSIEGEAGVNLTPSLTALLFGSYLNYDAPAIAGFTTGSSDDFDNFIVGGNLTYTVAKGLTVAGEAFYQDREYSVGQTDGLTDFDQVGGGVRVKRTF